MTAQKKLRRSKTALRRMDGYAIGALAVFSLVILAVLGYSLAEMQRTSTITAKHYAQSLAAQLTNTIDLEFSGRRVQVASIGDSFEKVVEKEDDAGLDEFIARKKTVCGFDFIALEDTKNDRLSTAGIEPEKRDAALAFLRGLDTTRLAYEGRNCRAGIEDENVIYAMPLYQGDVHIGFLWAGHTAESMQNIIRSRSFQEKTYSCIIDKDGKLVLSADHREAFQALAHIFERGNDEQLKKNMQQMESNIEAEQSGVFSFATDTGSRAYLAYTPMYGGERVMLTIMPTNIFSEDYGAFVYLAALAVAGTLLVFMGFLALLMRSHRVNRKELEHLAFFDEVTGGGNNQAFCMRYRELCRQADATQYAVALLDVVNFKTINKKFGSEQGNAVLRYLYEVIDGELDQSKGEFAARSEMDHFFLLLREQQPEGVQRRLDAVVERVNNLQKGASPAHLRHHLTFRMAAGFVTGREIDPMVLEDRVRSVLKMTESVPGKCAFYSDALAKRIRREQELDGAFEAALAGEEFQLYFQPKVSLSKGRIEGAEVLVRWLHPKQGLVPPNDFIPVLERNGKILRLDKYIFEKTCIWLQKREARGEAAIPVSVNLSRSHLLDENFLAWFVDTADRYGVRHELIEFELTESTFMDQEQIQQMRDYIVQMHELGFRLSIDDFGIGYSAISLLRQFDVDVIKLDRTFFLELDDHKARDVISCLIALAQKLSIGVVAEGIETLKQIDCLKALGSDVVQGYFFSRPLPEKEFDDWYRTFDYGAYGG